jgi:hypothetical protein
MYAIFYAIKKALAIIILKNLEKYISGDICLTRNARAKH